jgi:hypothetical protein
VGGNGLPGSLKEMENEFIYLLYLCFCFTNI